MVTKLQRLVKDDVQQRNMVTRVLRYFDDEDFNMNDYLILKKEYQRFIDENNIEEKNLLTHIRELKSADYDSYIPPVNNTPNTNTNSNTTSAPPPTIIPTEPNPTNEIAKNQSPHLNSNNEKIIYPSVNEKSTSSPLLSPKSSSRNLTEAIKRNIKSSNSTGSCCSNCIDIDNNIIPESSIVDLSPPNKTRSVPSDGMNNILSPKTCINNNHHSTPTSILLLLLFI